MPPPPRPAGTDYAAPDPPTARCPVCNPDGLNRTGLLLVQPRGTTATHWMSEPCPLGCRHGLKADDKEA